MAKQRPPDEFGEILHSPVQPLIVGGQAVNLWAYYYSFADDHLARQQPFMSKDADIFGDRKMVERLAKTPGWQVKFYDEPRQTAVALLWKEIPGDEHLLVEVLRAVKGLTPRDLADSDTIELDKGKTYRVASPIRMVKAKLANVAEIRPMREHDLRQLRLLVPICRHYLNDRLQSVRAGGLNERQWINAYHEFREIVSSPTARRLDQKFGLMLETAFPVAASTEGLAKITRLYAHAAARGPRKRTRGNAP